MRGTWWSKVYGSGIGEVNIIYCSGKANTNADALSRNPYGPAPPKGIAENEIQVAVVNSKTITDISTLLKATPLMDSHTTFREEQRKDSRVNEVIRFLETQELPSDNRRARNIASQLAILDGILYYIDHRRTI